MVESDLKSRASGVVLILFGLAGILYRLTTYDTANVYYLSLFLIAVLVGISSLLDEKPYSTIVLLTGAGVSLLGAIGRSAVHGITNPLALALGLLAIVLLWKSYRSHTSPTTVDREGLSDG